PWLASVDGHLPQVARIVPLVLDRVHKGWYAQGYEVVGVNNVASFPSYHTAESMLVVLAMMRYSRRLRWVGVWYISSMGFCLVYLGEHYLIDVLMGIAVATGSWYLAVKLLPSRLAVEEIEAGLIPLRAKTLSRSILQRQYRDGPSG